MHKNGDQREVRDSDGDQLKMQYQNKLWMELFQRDEITAEEVNMAVLMLSERESAIHWFRNEADSFSSMLQLQKICLHQFKIHI